MHGGPSEPSPEPAYLHLAALQHSKTLADHSHGALVKVAKWTRRAVTYDAAANQLSGITSLLNRYLSNPWQRFAILVNPCGSGRGWRERAAGPLLRGGF